MLILIDNTVLANFAIIGQPNLLQRALGNAAATTRAVMDEFTVGVARGRLPATDWHWLPILTLMSEEKTIYQELLRSLNAGESSCLAVAKQRQGRILTDDRDARKRAVQMQIPVSGTLGILVRLVQIRGLTLVEANNLLHQMMKKGYYAPLDRLDTLL